MGQQQETGGVLSCVLTPFEPSLHSDLRHKSVRTQTNLHCPLPNWSTSLIAEHGPSKWSQQHAVRYWTTCPGRLAHPSKPPKQQNLEPHAKSQAHHIKTPKQLKRGFGGFGLGFGAKSINDSLFSVLSLTSRSRPTPPLPNARFSLSVSIRFSLLFYSTLAF